MDYYVPIGTKRAFEDDYAMIGTEAPIETNYSIESFSINPSLLDPYNVLPVGGASCDYTGELNEELMKEFMSPELFNKMKEQAATGDVQESAHSKRRKSIMKSGEGVKFSYLDWSLSVPGQLWSICFKTLFVANPFAASKAVSKQYANKSIEFDISRTAEIIQHIIKKSPTNLVHHGITTVLFFKMLQACELQPAQVPTDPYFSKLVNTRKKEGVRRIKIGECAKPSTAKTKMCGIGIKRKETRRDHVTEFKHFQDLKFLSETIHATIGVIPCDTSVPAQHIVVRTIQNLLFRISEECLIPFGNYIGGCWDAEYFPKSCSIAVWDTIKLVAKIIATYCQSVRRGAVMGTIVGELGYSDDEYLPPFLGPKVFMTKEEADTVWEEGDKAKNFVMIGK